MLYCEFAHLLHPQFHIASQEWPSSGGSKNFEKKGGSTKMVKKKNNNSAILVLKFWLLLMSGNVNFGRKGAPPLDPPLPSGLSPTLPSYPRHRMFDCITDIVCSIVLQCQMQLFSQILLKHTNFYIYIHRVLSPIFLLKLTWFLSETIKCMCVAKLVWSGFSALRPASFTNIDF
jgi:hypothetical protein